MANPIRRLARHIRGRRQARRIAITKAHNWAAFIDHQYMLVGKGYQTAEQAEAMIERRKSGA